MSIITYFYIIILSVYGLKDIGWIREKENKTHICDVYKRPTLDWKTDTYTESKGMEKDISCKWKRIKTKQNTGIAILISDQID